MIHAFMSARAKAAPAATSSSGRKPSSHEDVNGSAILKAMLVRAAGGAKAEPGVARTVSGHLTGIDDEGRLLFLEEGSTGEPVPVAIGMEISDGVLVKAARVRRRALVVRTADANPRLVLVGLVRERVAAKARDARPGQLEVELDGETVRLHADRNIELRCGAASLILRKDGKVVITGTNVISSSRGANRIRGGTISLN